MKKLPIYPTEQNSTVKEPFQMTNTKHLKQLCKKCGKTI